MNSVDHVRRAFRSKYSFDIQATWLQACLAWLRDQYQLADVTNSYSLERIYQQWLHTDLALIADAHCLPNDLDLNAKKVQLTGKYGLQINSLLCISEPYYTQVVNMRGDQNENERIDTDITETQQWKPPPPKRVLYLELTDGKTILRGLEYEAIAGLERDTTLPGAKILVSGPVTFRRGMLLLTSKNTQILGGYVEALLDRNSSMETTLLSLSKTASRLDESRVRFDRLAFKLHVAALPPPPTAVLTDTSTNQNASRHDEEEMDEFIRQAYADGMFDDDSRADVDPMDQGPPAITSTARLNPVSTASDRPEDVIYILDDDDRFFEQEMPPLPSPPVQPTLLSRQSSTTRPPTITVSLPYTYLSLIRAQSIPSHKSHQDHLIKGCFSSLSSNPRLVKGEFDLQAYLNDGSDCLKVRLASDLLSQRIGMTGSELISGRNSCTSDMEKQRFQTDFNERLKKFGHAMQYLHALITVRLFSDGQMPMVMKIQDSES